MIEMATISDDGEPTLSSTKQEKSPFQRAIPQILAVSIKNILLLAFGTSIGFPTILIGSLSTPDPDPGFTMSENAISWIGSLAYLCNPLGSILSGFTTHRFGRRRCMQLVNIPYITAWLLLYSSTKPWQVFVGLGLMGFSGGFLEPPIITYVAEITEPRLRGALSSTSSMSINLGILLAFILGTFISWRSLALVNSSIPIAGLILLFLVPESPYWLISQNRLDEAQKSLAWLRGWAKPWAVEEEFFSLYAHLQKHPMYARSPISTYLKLNFLRPFALISATFVLSHFWSTPVNVYAIKVFNIFQVPIGPYQATIYIGIVELVAVITCVFAIKLLGKRVLTHISLIGVFFCILCTGAYCQISGAHYLDHGYTESPYSWIPVVALLGQAFFTYLCIKGLPWILIGELYDNDVRSFGSGFSSAAGYVMGFAANKTFLDLVSSATLPGVMWMYSAVTLVGATLLYFWMPETEGKSLAQITEHYSGGDSLDNKVFRDRSSPRKTFY